MAKACYYHGFVIEFDTHLRRLTVDGQEIAIPQTPAASTAALIAQCKSFVDASSNLAARDAMRDEHVELLKQGTEYWNEWRVQHPLVRPLLYDAELNRLHSGENRTSMLNLAHANMTGAQLIEANLRNANLYEANLGGANLSSAHLEKAHLCRTDLYETTLQNAHLPGVNLQGTQLAKTDCRGADLTGCRVYGLSAWDIKVDKQTRQQDLSIIYEMPQTEENRPAELAEVTVDDLQVAQFIYLLLNNDRIRNVVDTVTSKVVLILGRFTPERKAVLNAVRDELRKRDYVPVIFDFEKPRHRDLTETVRTLASLAKFVIADLTDPSSLPHELATIVPDLPSVPIQPILLVSQREYGMYEHFTPYPWVLDIVPYQPETESWANLVERVIAPAEQRLAAANTGNRRFSTTGAAATRGSR